MDSIETLLCRLEKKKLIDMVYLRDDEIRFIVKWKTEKQIWDLLWTIERVYQNYVVYINDFKSFYKWPNPRDYEPNYVHDEVLFEIQKRKSVKQES